MTARSSNPEHRWVQPIIIDKASSHEDAVSAAAKASVLVRLQDHTGSPFPVENYEHWLDGPFTKTVRRASAAQISGLIQFWAKENNVPYAVVEDGSAVAVAFPPMRYEDMPKQIAKFQVHGTDFARDEPVPGETEPIVRVLVNDDLTTGKAAAAAAHALWAWMLPLAHSEDPTFVTFIDKWIAAGCPFGCNFVVEGFIDDLVEMADAGRVVPIRDAGLTEVDPGTITAVALCPFGVSPGDPVDDDDDYDDDYQEWAVG